MSHDRRGGGHGGGDEVGAAAFALPAFEVAVAGAGAALAGFELVGVHGQAHAAAGFAPFEPGFFEDAIEAFRFFFAFFLSAAGHNHGVNGARGFVVFDDGGGGAEV